MKTSRMVVVLGTLAVVGVIWLRSEKEQCAWEKQVTSHAELTESSAQILDQFVVELCRLPIPQQPLPQIVVEASDSRTKIMVEIPSMIGPWSVWWEFPSEAHLTENFKPNQMAIQLINAIEEARDQESLYQGLKL